MNLDRALEVALEACDYLSRQGHHDSKKFADALPRLRAFLETGLPFYRAAEEVAAHIDEQIPTFVACTSPDKGDQLAIAMVAAYRAAKEGT